MVFQGGRKNAVLKDALAPATACIEIVCACRQFGGLGTRANYYYD